MTGTTARTFQVRFHGRGGQGVVTAAELLSVAAFLEGRYSQAFPSFGSERAGAPVTAFCRVSDAEIRTRSPIAEPDALVVQDPTLLHLPDLFSGLKRGGCVLVNTARDPGQVLEALGQVADQIGAGRLVTVPATELALAHLGRPLPNAVLLGGLAAATGIVGLETVQQAIAERFRGAVAEANSAAAAAAYRLVSAERAAGECLPSDHLSREHASVTAD